MTETQHQQCAELIQRLTEAGIQVSLHEFRTMSGFRVLASDGKSKRLLRDGEDPVALLNTMIRRFGLNKEE
jgi:hypothetical protein